MPRPVRSFALPIALILAAPFGVSLGAQAEPAAARFTSWSVKPYGLFGDSSYSSTTAVAKGRIWQITFDPPSRPVLRWRRLSDGRGGAVVVKVPGPRDSPLVVDDYAVSAQLEISGNRGFVAGNWCIVESEDGGGCEWSRGFDVQFDIRNGRILRSAKLREAPLLVGGTRISYIARPASNPMVLRDAISRRAVFRFPRGAREVQGAGRYVSWKTPGAYERRYGDSGPDPVGSDWTVMHVRERASGRATYDLRHGALRRSIQRRGSAVQSALLRPDGSLWLSAEVDPKRPFYPVVVDRHGRIRWVTEQPMRKPNQFSSEIRGTRVLLDVDTNGSGRCGPDTGWLTEIGGRRGSSLRHLPRRRGYAISQVPWFITPLTMGWIEEPTDERRGTGTYRVRVGHDLRTLPLSRRDRPRC